MDGFYCHKGQTIWKANYGFLNSSKKGKKLTILSREDAQDSEFCSFFGRIEDTINCLRDLCRVHSIFRFLVTLKKNQLFCLFTFRMKNPHFA